MATKKSTKSTKKSAKAATASKAVRPSQKMIMWVNHFDLLPGDSSVTTSFNAVSSGVGGGLTGLVIQSSTTGENAQGGGNKVVHMGLQVPPGYMIKRVRVCYELSNKRSFISQIRLAQVQTPPQSAVVKLDDGTDQSNPGPICTKRPQRKNPPRELMLNCFSSTNKYQAEPGLWVHTFRFGVGVKKKGEEVPKEVVKEEKSKRRATPTIQKIGGLFSLLHSS